MKKNDAGVESGTCEGKVRRVHGASGT